MHTCIHITPTLLLPHLSDMIIHHLVSNPPPSSSLHQRKGRVPISALLLHPWELLFSRRGEGYNDSAAFNLCFHGALPFPSLPPPPPPPRYRCVTRRPESPGSATPRPTQSALKGRPRWERRVDNNSGTLPGVIRVAVSQLRPARLGQWRTAARESVVAKITLSLLSRV